jgi:signal transduction histidine kinase/DNA-binding response OmpR family regulator
MSTIKHGADVNLLELRSQLAGRLAVVVIVGSYIATVMTMWPIIMRQPYPADELRLLIALLAIGAGVRLSVNTYPTAARHLLVWGLVAVMLAAMWTFTIPWLPFAGLTLVFVSAMLVAGSEFVTMGAVAALATWLTYSGARAYPLPGLLVALASGMIMAWLVVRTLYTALGWAWTMQQRADHLLELARDRQGELSNALKSVDSANAILRRTQRELIAARKQAEEARLMKEQFAANVSHELRTPLNIIMGFSEMMYLSPEVYGEVSWPTNLRQDVYQIYSSSRHLLEMIDDVLDLSRFEMMRFTLNKEPTPLEPLLREAMDIATGLFRGRPIQLETEISRDLPTLEVDRTRIRQVLLNLLNNAAHFTEAGKVRVEAKQADGEVLVSVGDTGPGIPADKASLIFDEFYQVDRSLHRKHGGTGLGLAISKRFVEAHDGRIWVESEEGAGSTFTFTLPIPGEYVPLARVKMDRPLELPREETRVPILVVDPDPAVADLVRRYIEEYEVIQVEDAEQVTEEVLLHHPQAVVYNVPPGEDERHQNLSLPVPFIECSLPSRSWVANDLAVAACLTKPVTREQLLHELGRLGNVHDVLVVDDDWGFCQLVVRTLEAASQSYKVRRAYDGADGLQAMRDRRPDVVLLDLIMPGVDGFEVLERMRTAPQLADVPVILVTATSYAEDALEQRRGQVVIRRAEGLNPAEVLRCLRAVTGVLKPQYDERATPEDVLAQSKVQVVI